MSATPMQKCQGCGELRPHTREYFVWRLGTLSNLCKVCSRTRSNASFKKRHAGQAPGPSATRPRRAKKAPETILEKHIEAFLQARRTLAPNTVLSYELILNRYVGYCPGWPPTPESITDFITRPGLADSTKRTLFQVLKGFCTWLEKTHRLEDNPIRKVLEPRQPDILPRCPKPKHIVKLFDHLEREVEAVLARDERLWSYTDYIKIRDLAIFSLLFDAGMRVSEAAGLNVADVDFEEDSVFIRAAKRQKQRYVVIAKKARGNLKLWLKVRKGLPVGELGKDDKEALFLYRYGNHWGRLTVYQVEGNLQRLCKALDLPRITPHQLRHAHASHTLNNGGNIERLRQQLGHSNIAMTARYFRLPNEGRLKDHQKTSPLDNLGGAI